MQHIVHIFVGDELVSFRDRFSSIMRQEHKNITNPFFTTLSLTKTDSGAIKLLPDESGDALDGCVLNRENLISETYNFFDNLYVRKVTIDNPGNRSLVIVLWAKLYSESYIDDLKLFIESIINFKTKSDSNPNINIEISGFTNDAVSIFIPNVKERADAGIYKRNFDENLKKLRQLRSHLTAFRLIANRNMENIALNFNEETIARVCTEYAAVMCEKYPTLCKPFINPNQYPFESFGLSAILFDRKYYYDYIRNRVFLDAVEAQNVKARQFNINSLAQKTNPILQEIIDEIKSFYQKQVAEARAKLGVAGGYQSTDVVGTVDDALTKIKQRLSEKINSLISSGEITVFEAEALLTLILGDDCDMFEPSAVFANELILDDIIDESVRFFIDKDEEDETLCDISQKSIKDIRNKMRNIALADRDRRERIKILDCNREESSAVQSHIAGNEYDFNGSRFKLDLEIDNDPLEIVYTPHDVSDEAFDLRDSFLPIRNQGAQGSCASFAIASVIEFMRRDQCRYSPAFLYWNARGNANHKEDSGASIYNVIKGAVDNGICKEDKMPYNQDVFTIKPSDHARKDALDCRVIEAQTVQVDLTSIKSALADGYPVIVGAQIFDSFSDTKCGFVVMPSEEEINKGRSDEHAHHAMVVCGYSDKEKVFVVRNSWGTSFGDKGYCYIPYTYAKKYFHQACIITKISSSDVSIKTGPAKQTLNFNVADNNVEVAILENLIAEDQFVLSEMAEESNVLKGKWSQNIATLLNVNNQNALIEKAKDKIQGEINLTEGKINELVDSKEDKVKDFKRSYRLQIVLTAIPALVSLVTLIAYPSIIMGIAFGILFLIFSIVLGRYFWNWREYRQSLRDEIGIYSNRKSALEEEKFSLDIKAHIHGRIIKEIEDYRLYIQSQMSRFKRLNYDIVALYGRTVEIQANMTPSVGYPFLAVLENETLDIYYNKWRERMLCEVDLKVHDINVDLFDWLNNDRRIKSQILRGLRDFNMREYITQTNKERWLFLPHSHKLEEIMPALDNRAIPFCPYGRNSDYTPEKYLLAKNITTGDVSHIDTYFSQAPLPVSIDNPDGILIVKIVRYNLN